MDAGRPGEFGKSEGEEPGFPAERVWLWDTRRKVRGPIDQCAVPSSGKAGRVGGIE